MMTVMDVGTAAELEAAHRAQYRSLVQLAALLVDDVGQCEELVQDAFVRVFSRRDRPHDARTLAAYLRSAVLNGARSALRRRQTARRFAPPRPGEADSADAALTEVDRHHAVLRALRSLPDRQRDVLALRYWGDLSEADIADALGIAAGTVKTHARRGLAALAELLEDER